MFRLGNISNNFPKRALLLELKLFPVGDNVEGDGELALRCFDDTPRLSSVLHCLDEICAQYS